MQRVDSRPRDVEVHRVFMTVSGGDMCNVGDIAMLQVAVARVRRLLPDAEIHVLTGCATRTERFLPTARPVMGDGRNTFFAPGSLFKQLALILPECERRAIVRFPCSTGRIIALKKRLRGRPAPEVLSFLKLIRSSSLVIATGGGYITDAFSHHGRSSLDTLEMAQRWGIPTALVGQGIGPIRGTKLRDAVRRVLSRAGLVCLREKRTGSVLLDELGIDPTRVVVTGDDAIELARPYASTSLGDALGINLRIANYAAVNSGHLVQMRDVAHSIAAELGAPLAAIPISSCPDASDRAHLDVLLDGFPRRLPILEPADEPASAIRSAGRCRVVVTGSYHAAVFALSQGVPAVCLTNSEYYADKFYGLREMFGAGCEVLTLGAADYADRLRFTVSNLWKAAAELRPFLLSAADRQIDVGNEAYNRLRQLLPTSVPV